MNNNNKRILLFGCTHAPYNHPDLLPFLSALKKKYNPTRVIHMGDEVDMHAMSFHDTDEDLPSAGDELIAATKTLKQIEKLFPKLDLLDSNHGSLHIRKMKHHGIPLKFLASPQSIYGVSNKWQWHNELTLKLPNGQDLYLVHGMVKDGLKLAVQRGVNVAQAHYHTEFNIKYAGNPSNLLFSLQVGCLINKHALAFAYDKLNLSRPIIGAAVIIDSKARLEPMILSKKGRWVGKL